MKKNVKDYDIAITIVRNNVGYQNFVLKSRNVNTIMKYAKREIRCNAWSPIQKRLQECFSFLAAQANRGETLLQMHSIVQSDEFVGVICINGRVKKLTGPSEFKTNLRKENIREKRKAQVAKANDRCRKLKSALNNHLYLLYETTLPHLYESARYRNAFHEHFANALSALPGGRLEFDNFYSIAFDDFDVNIAIYMDRLNAKDTGTLIRPRLYDIRKKDDPHLRIKRHREDMLHQVSCMEVEVQETFLDFITIVNKTLAKELKEKE